MIPYILYYFTLQYHFATKGDVFLLTFGILAAITHGASFPILALLFGRMVDGFLSVLKVKLYY
jgi:hypothetical protein